jgi:phosphoribosylformylglycinamidine cyclo-ligase
MVAVVPAERSDDALALLADRKVPAWRLGEIVAGSGQVQLRGDYGGLAATWR